MFEVRQTADAWLVIDNIRSTAKVNLTVSRFERSFPRSTRTHQSSGSHRRGEHSYGSADIGHKNTQSLPTPATKNLLHPTPPGERIPLNLLQILIAQLYHRRRTANTSTNLRQPELQ
jgi:hypothetical protein